MTMLDRITSEQLSNLQNALHPLIGQQFQMLTLPIIVLQAFEPSQIGTIVGSLMDALIPHLSDIPSVGLTKHEGILGNREGYPDYRHTSGFRLELKLLYVDNPQLKMKKPPTPREPSARLTQKVTVKNVVPHTDALLLIAYQLQPQQQNSELVSPTIIDLGVLSMIELIEARDNRMIAGGGRWFDNFETPTVLSEQGLRKRTQNATLDTSSYGRKASENRDYNEDTNFGKLSRIPYPFLQDFLQKHGSAIRKTKTPTLQEVVTELQAENLDELPDNT